MSEKVRPAFADYVVTALSPVLIMGLIGSLVFFLVEILYAGRYEGRLLWTLFFYVFGTVLVARIAIQTDPGRAYGYGSGLALVSWFALQAFVKYPQDGPTHVIAGLINLGLIALMWWCAHKLTWDCTFIDEKRPASSRGLLAAAGLEHRPEIAGQVGADQLAENAPATGRQSLARRWQRFREQRARRAHSPGLSVVWFSLAALPLFGLGQSLIPVTDTARRHFTFWLAIVYVACALGLLLTTSFLGLRRYLRQRQLPMPATLAATWLGSGALLIVSFLFVGALLPRPYSESPIWDFKRAISTERQSSKNAVIPDEAGKTNGQRTSKDGEPSKEEKKTDGGESAKSSPGDKAGDDGPKGSREGRSSETTSGETFDRLLTFVKWLVFGILALLVLGFLARGMVRYLANFMPGVRRLLDALAAWWARRRPQPLPRQSAEFPIARPPPPGFATFSNPFHDGSGHGRSVEELIDYSFRALEAWAADRQHGRQQHETVLEFTARLSNTFAALENQPRQLAVLVVRLAYAQGSIPADSRQKLVRFWDQLAQSVPSSE